VLVQGPSPNQAGVRPGESATPVDAIDADGAVIAAVDIETGTYIND
jgi:hypothetical protein